VLPLRHCCCRWVAELDDTTPIVVSSLSIQHAYLAQGVPSRQVTAHPRSCCHTVARSAVYNLADCIYITYDCPEVIVLQALSQYLVNINVWAHNILTLCARAFCSKEVQCLLCTAPTPPCCACD
jgi:hypothetical protein